MAHPYDGILVSNKKEWAVSPQKDMENLKSILLSERREPVIIHAVWLQVYDILEKAKL